MMAVRGYHNETNALEIDAKRSQLLPLNQQRRSARNE